MPDRPVKFFLNLQRRMEASDKIAAVFALSRLAAALKAAPGERAKDPGEALRLVAAALQSLRVPFFVGGALASSVHGMCRATGGVDMIVQLEPGRVDEIRRKLEPHFREETGASGEAVSLVHCGSGFRVSFFPLQKDGYSRRQYRRRRNEEYQYAGGELKLPVCSAEDTILAKLVWLRRHPEAAAKHRADAAGIVEVRGGDLDLRYLRKWSAELEVSELLQEVLSRGPNEASEAETGRR